MILASTCIISGACGSEKVKTRRDIYSSKQDCLKDFGAEDCEETSSGHYGPHYVYLQGRPYYFRRGYREPIAVEPSKGFSRTSPEAPSSHASGVLPSSRTVRGGFGSMGALHGAGG